MIEDFCINQTSLNEIAFEEIKVYPNPVNDVINISTNGSFTKMEIYDIKGRIVLKNNFPPTFMQLDVSNFSEGIYVIRLTKDGMVSSVKFVK
ncbi:MAG: T9SS type A sorting domain-containing protein [Flavobacteriales bacterium]